MIRFLTLTLALGVALLGSARAAHVHVAAKAKLKKGKEHHELHHDKHHTVHAHTFKEKLKVKSVTAVHHHKGKNKTVKVAKFKAKEKFHKAAAPGREQHYYISTEAKAAAAQDGYVGYAMFHRANKQWVFF